VEGDGKAQGRGLSARVWNAIALVAGFIVGLALLNLVALVLDPLARFSGVSGVVEVVLGGLGLLILCGAWVAGTWVVATLMRRVLHVNTTLFGEAR
jgi:hypothetical protein